ncbi:Protein of unknown function (DUF3592) [Beggiatoa alba B18LD]|uniref:DUF3592 domain-containing protein n=1 Tax=Beggiatoa alba B18LD TaxID=395493 RepID=I3CGJ0_9GAMM|nr:DUF3592 domain-containing protein [Beggiatoa alba]EIJ42733.1 Protein of unknown function (DUF3592) [Beggiatoa alba B18LD]
MRKHYLFPIFAGLIMLMGVSLLAVGFIEFNHARDSVNWLETTGKIIQSHVSQKSVSRDQHEQLMYIPQIRYEYTFEGRIYQSDRVNFLPQSTTQVDAEAVSQRYPVGKIVTVYCNPDNLQLAVLEVGASQQNYEPLILGVFLLVLGSFLLRKHYKK